MSYLLADVEVTRPLPTLALAEHDAGMAVLLRRRGRPVAFWMEALQARTVLTPADLARRIDDRAGTKLVREALWEQLAPLRAHASPPARSSRPPSLTVAVCTKDRPETLACCLASLLALRPADPEAGDVAMEVLVVDNAPSDRRTQQVVAALPGVRYVCEPLPGLDFARNRALREASGDLLAFLDDDVVVDPGWLAGLLEACAENPDAAAFTGQVLPYELATEAQILFEKRGGFRRGFERVRYRPERPGDPIYPCGAGIFGTGANMAFRREVLRDLGGFDEALDTGAPLPAGGDHDIFYRVLRAGHTLVYEPGCLVFHRHRRELDALRRQLRNWGTGVMAFVAKSYRTEPAQRPRLRRLVRWWFGDQFRRLFRSLRRRHPLPPGMVLAELRGGVVGLLGEYGRSARRIERIRRQVP